MERNNSRNSRNFAKHFAGLLRDTFELEISRKLEGIIASNLFHVGESNYDDLGSWVVLECLEETVKGNPLDERALIRIIDRVRHRITRAALRLAGTSQEPADRDPIEGKIQAVRDFLMDPPEGITTLHIYVFYGHFLEGRKVADLSVELGVSPSTIYRMISRTKDRLAHSISDGIS